MSRSMEQRLEKLQQNQVRTAKGIELSLERQQGLLDDISRLVSGR